jgi:hypothetical protein
MGIWNGASSRLWHPGLHGEGQGEPSNPVNPKGRLAAVLNRRTDLGPDTYVFGSTNGAYQPTIQTAWETLKLLANGIEPRAGVEGVTWNQEQLRRIDLRWHDLRHEGACRLLADGVDIRIIQLMYWRPSTFAVCRCLPTVAALCCTERARKGQLGNWSGFGILAEHSQVRDADLIESRGRTVGL